MNSSSSRDVFVEAFTDSQSMVAPMQFCAERYEATYRTHWRAFPGVLFVAYPSGDIVSTLGMELGTRHPQFGAERYFHLSPRMQAFLHEHRAQVAELGRFASHYQAGARAVFRAAIDFALSHGIVYFLTWANPTVTKSVKP